MEFKEYKKMQSDLKHFICTTEVKNTPWIVLEKVHGANFSFHTDGYMVQNARRRDFLGENENFFNCNDAEFMKEYPDRIKNVFGLVSEIIGEKPIQVSVYGELFGGVYTVNGNDLHSGKQKPVQHELQYCPDVRWTAFDITYRTTEDPSHTVYLDPVDTMNIFEKVDIFYLKPLFKGSMSEALNFELGFDSTLPKIFGLPALPKGSNKAEGIVVKPIRTIKCPLRKNEAKLKRVVLKIKRIDFAEHQPKAPVAGKAGVKKVQTKMQKVLPKLMCYATDSRMVNAVSKVGYPDNERAEKLLIDEFTTDLFADAFDAEIEAAQIWDSFDDVEKGKIKDILRKKTLGLIKKYKNSR